MTKAPVVGAALGVIALPLFVLVLVSPGTAANACPSTPQQTSAEVNQSIVATADAEALHRGASPRVLLALFEAGLDESGFRDLANANVPASLAIPHDGVGDDHTSVGYLQQQVGPAGDGGGFGWGTVTEAMDSLHATDAFLDAAVPLDASLIGDAATLAQAVQRSATTDGSNYRAYQDQASSLIAGKAPSGTGAAAPVAPVQRPVGKLSPASGAYVGTYSSTTGLKTTTEIENYFQAREALAGRNFAIQNFMPGWSAPLDSPLVKWDIAQGTIPLISWNTPEGISDQEIAGGSQDGLIRAQATRIKALGADVFIRVDWEMNGNWFAWDGTHNGGPGTGPAAYVAMWRHIHDVFTSAGVTNVAWVWTPAAASLPDAGWNAVAAYYPGDAYVDWVGLDDYNYGGQLGHALGWNDFASQLQPIYGDYAERKPIMIGEMGSADHIAGHDKGQWIQRMASDVETKFPDIQALVWFDVKYDEDWRFDTSASSLAAFRVWLAEPYYNPSAAADVGGAASSSCDDGDGAVGPGTSTTSLPTGLTITGTPAGIQAVQYALAQLGKPYVWGAAGPDSFDCSGLTMAAWSSAGVTLPHFTGDQVEVGTAEPTDLSQAQAGDLVFIPGSDGSAVAPRHVGLVAGTVTDATGRHLYLVEAPHTGAGIHLVVATAWSNLIVNVRHIA
ncbi:hypothetical protein acdb102_21680 [Acidothermaceae bacterium B102]|nr:hypothetical protein acdb102_21680 [Acidothermaceae bacterium B102]